MKQAIAGVAPRDLGEVTIMTVWPSVASTGIGRMMGGLCANRAGIGPFFTLGKLFALAFIPLAIPVYFWMRLPGVAKRYRLTNKRIVVENPYTGKEVGSIGLGDFDAIKVDVLSGQAWYPAGELRFLRGPVEVFVLSGVSRPESFRQVCLKAHRSYVGVTKALAHRTA